MNDNASGVSAVMTSLEKEFNMQCEALGVSWYDEDVRQESLKEFITDYQNGQKTPKVRLCGYGYRTFR